MLKLLQRLIQYFLGNPVTLKSGRTAINKTVNLTAARSMEAYLKILETQKAKNWLRKLTPKQLSTIKTQIAKQRITPKQLQLKINAKTLEKTDQNRGELPMQSDFKLHQGDMKLQKLYGAGDKGVIGVYGKAVDKDPKVFLALANKANVSNYISYQQVVREGKIGYYLSIKTEMLTADPGTFKSLMTRLSKILPLHKLFEKTSISTDGIMMWKNQIKAGYKTLSETFTVPVNNAGIKTKLGGTGDRFAEAQFFSKESAEAAKTKIEELIKGIKNSKVEIIFHKAPPKPPLLPGKTTLTSKPVTSRYELKVTLPVLQSTMKSLAALGIISSMIDPSVLKNIQSKG
jgi:hypothetical protein